VPFSWTLSLWPYWLWYVGAICALAYRADRRAYARESTLALARDRTHVGIGGLGTRAAVGGTPGFVFNGYLVSGAQPFEAFDGVIKLAIKGG
jgi:hypothetical protein